MAVTVYCLHVRWCAKYVNSTIFQVYLLQSSHELEISSTAMVSKNSPQADDRLQSTRLTTSAASDYNSLQCRIDCQLKSFVRAHTKQNQSSFIVQNVASGLQECSAVDFLRFYMLDNMALTTQDIQNCVRFSCNFCCFSLAYRPKKFYRFKAITRTNQKMLTVSENGLQ